LTVPSYALRLVRRFGTKRVGWFIVTAFSSLASLHLAGAIKPMNAGPVSGFTLDSIMIFGSVLLLIGMGHVETLFSEREQTRSLEDQLRRQWESRVKDETAELARANQELLQELTQRAETQKVIEESLAQYRLLFMENPQPMWILDLRTCRFLTVNNAALRQYGFTREEFSSLSGRDLLLPEQAAEFLRDISKPCTGVESRGLWRHCRKDGTLMDVEATSLDLQCGGSAARLVLATDVTPRRRREAELLNSRKMETVGQVAGGVAHHVNNLLTIIEGHVSVLLDNPRDLKSTEELAHISSAVTRAASLTRQLLAAGGRQLMRVEPVDLNALIRRLHPMLRRLVGDDIVVEHSLSPRALPVQVDSHLMEHVIVNLVLNARQAMPAGGDLAISTDRVLGDEILSADGGQARTGEFVRLTISDTGCGMTPEVQSHLFEPFFTTRETGSAMGLGLASVYGLVKQFSGWIEFTSNVGTGTEFRVFLPCAPAPAPEKTASASQFRATILLVEPQDRPRALARFVLDRHNYRVIEADCAATAMMLLAGKTSTIDALLTDVDLTGDVSGRELADRLLKTRPDLKVIFTAQISPDAEEQNPPGMEGVAFIPQPFRPDSLLKTMQDVLG
jgi:PAS domain S-box-containing protein